jgi:hypothetical protein
MIIEHQSNLSREEAHALDRATKQGGLSARLYRQGVYSEADFVLLGVLQRLVIRGRLVYLGLSGEGGDAVYSYAPMSNAAVTQPARAAA